MLKTAYQQETYTPPVTVVEELEDFKLLSNGQFTIDGFAVPHVLVQAVSGGKDVETEYHVSLDWRIGTYVKGFKELVSLMWFVANAMAVTKGYTSFGKNLRPNDEFNIKPIDPLNSPVSKES